MPCGCILFTDSSLRRPVNMREDPRMKDARVSYQFIDINIIMISVSELLSTFPEDTQPPFHIPSIRNVTSSCFVFDSIIEDLSSLGAIEHDFSRSTPVLGQRFVCLFRYPSRSRTAIPDRTPAFFDSPRPWHGRRRSRGNRSHISHSMARPKAQSDHLLFSLHFGVASFESLSDVDFNVLKSTLLSLGCWLLLSTAVPCKYVARIRCHVREMHDESIC